jgi:hypothetical protein
MRPSLSLVPAVAMVGTGQRLRIGSLVCAEEGVLAVNVGVVSVRGGRRRERFLPCFPLLCNSPGSALLSEIFFAFFGAKFADILNAPCVLSSAAKVLSFLAFVCGKEEDPRGGGLDRIISLFFNDEASVAF